jgi:tryptophanyl-tRNA synthetase
MRPTGKLHIGHYFGALENWVRLQNDSSYDCFYFIADWHALTSDYADTSAVAQNTIEIATDYLAAGLDPQKSVIFQQSLVSEHAELFVLLAMMTPLGWLEREPTYKEALENLKHKDLHMYGFLGYPVLQTADIVMYGEPGAPLLVPVGEDQVSHVEVSRDIVRRFNAFNGFSFREEFFAVWARHSLEKAGESAGNPSLLAAAEKIVKNRGALSAEERTLVVGAIRKHVSDVGLQNFLDTLPRGRELVLVEEILTEPAVLLTRTPRIPGLDGRKMSKSYGNAITLSESDEEIRRKTKVMVTDPARKRRSDPGNPDICPVYDWHRLFSPQPTLEWAAEGCRTAGIGCIECKAKMADHLIEWIAPIRERRAQYEQNPARVLEVIDAGSLAARRVAKGTMERVREAVFGWQKKRSESKAVSVEVHDTHG